MRALPGLAAQLQDSLELVKQRSFFDQDPAGVLPHFFKSTVDHFTAGLVPAIAELCWLIAFLTRRYYDVIRQIQLHLSQEVELPTEIKNELAQYAQPEHRQAVVAATQRCSDVYSAVEALDAFLAGAGCAGVGSEVNNHIVQFVVSSIVEALQSLSTAPRTVTAIWTSHA